MKKLYKHNLGDWVKAFRYNLLFLLFLSPAIQSSAQALFTGRVTDSTGSGLSGVTVSVKGTSKGTITDNEGKFSISIPDNKSVLVVSYLGYKTQELSVGNSTTAMITLATNSELLQETVVTALGIKRSQRLLGYSVTKVSGADITNSREVNPINSLEGKVAGVNISPLTTGPSGSSNVLIRGENSISGNNQPLYVIDGVPIDNSNLGSAGEWGGYDAGDATSGINPDDIENVTVLKGAAASALYGYRAAGGVIMITTKRGESRKGVGVEFNSNLSLDQAIDYRDYQTQYGQGELGLAPQSEAEALNAGYSSWGGPLDGSSVVQFDGVSRPYSAVTSNFENFYRTGSTFTNTLGLTAGNDNSSLRFSASHLDNAPVIMNSSYNRSSFSINGDSKLGKKLSASVSGRYVTESSHNRSSVSDAPGNPNAGVAMLPTSYDVNVLKNKYIDSAGNEIPIGDIFTTNPYWAIYQFENDVKKNTVIGTAQLRWDIWDGLYAQARATTDWLSFANTNVTPSGTAYQLQGSLNRDLRTISELNWEGLIGYTKDLTSALNLNAFVGANRQDNSFDQNSVSGTTFSIPGLYTIGNLLNKTPSDYRSKSRVNSVYGSAELGFKDYLFLTLTGRNDWFSTLNINNNSVFYPSASVGFIFSDLFKLPDWFSYGKIRLAYSQVGGSDVTPYSLSLTYGLDGSHNAQPLGQINESTLPNSNLRPRLITEGEGGFDVRFFQNRIGVDFSAYSKKTTNDIVTAAVSEASSYNNVYLNLGEITNKGVELLVTAVPVKTKKFSWETAINLSNNTNKVVEITGDTALNSIELAASRDQTTAVYAVVGQPSSQIGGSGYLRDANGQIVNANGLPVATPTVQYYGTGIAPFQAGWVNTIKYSRWTLFFQIDMKSGAKIFSGTDAAATAAGLTQQTLAGRGGDNNYIGPGVDQTTGQTNTTAVKPWDYWGNTFNTITEPWVYSADFGKLRQIGISYDIPASLLKHTTFAGATISFQVRNVAMLWKSAPNIDPESSYTNGGLSGVAIANGTQGFAVGAQGLELWSLPTTRSYQIDLDFKF